MRNLILYGGTFDPVHYGHLETARHVQEHFHFDEFYFLPCKIPILKDHSHASVHHRLSMLRLALAEMPSDLHFQIDESEIKRETPSYMVTTLRKFRQNLGIAFPITILIGYDVFCQLPLWYQWETLIELCNILVIDRQEFKTLTLPPDVQFLLRQHENKDGHLLLKQSHGIIHRFNAGHYAISSTQIRQKFEFKENCSTTLPYTVQTYILEHALYTHQD